VIAILCVIAGLIVLAGLDTADPVEDPQQPESPPLPRLRPSDDGTHFVAAGSGERVELWGFNYDHDGDGRLLENYWHDEWPTVVEDFQEMKALGANVVRIHLQLPKFMDAPDQPNQANLEQLRRLVRLAERTGLYLDITGLGCYHKEDVPDWYEELEEPDRWDVQARFWEAVAGVCQDSPAIFCYDLMNEPVLTGGPGEGWLVGEPLGGKYFVQRITKDLRGRSRQEVARAWVESLTSAIREVDDQAMITVGVIPWAYTFPGAKPLFHDPEVGRSLDFVSVHFYPEAGDIDGALKALAVYEIGKPLVVEEIFPLKAGIEETESFIERADHVDGWISFYWGRTIAENEAVGDLRSAIIAKWLRAFLDRSP